VADSEPTMIAINSVVAERADEFEEWLRSVVVPACNERRPETRGLWRVLRATEADNGVVVFAFVFQGGVPDDWELEPILVEALGQDGADDALAAFAGMLKGEQQSWAFTEVPLDGV
jgi:hypothetical protein